MSTRRPSALFLSAIPLSIIAVAYSIIVFNGGIAVGSSNHVGLIPVVRRLLNPDYLPGDFNIELRLYHHRVFAWMLARLSSLFGEDAGIIILHLISVLALSTALFYFSRALTLPVWAFALLGFLLSVSALWIGQGLEENNFAGNAEVQPTTLAHAFVLAGVTALIHRRYRWCAFFAGLTAMMHLQIGFVFILVIAPFFAVKLKEFGVKEVALLALVFLLPAAPALWNAQKLLARGVSNSAFTIEYLKFRMPHHFELLSPAAGIWFLLHVTLLIGAYLWFRQRDSQLARPLQVLMMMTLLLCGLIVLHGLDYYWLHLNRTLKFQFPRLSPLVTVFGGAVALAWIGRIPSRPLQATLLTVILVAAGFATWKVVHQPDRFSASIKRYHEQKSDWADVCRWIKANGETGVYLAPPGRPGFTYLSERSSVVEFKINPDGGQFLPEWTERLTDFCGGTLPTGRGLENRRLIDRAYSKLTLEQLLALSAKYNAPYAILPQASQLQLPILYENRDFRLVRTPRAF